MNHSRQEKGNQVAACQTEEDPTVIPMAVLEQERGLHESQLREREERLQALEEEGAQARAALAGTREDLQRLQQVGGVCSPLPLLFSSPPQLANDRAMPVLSCSVSSSG